MQKDTFWPILDLKKRKVAWDNSYSFRVQKIPTKEELDRLKLQKKKTRENIGNFTGSTADSSDEDDENRENPELVQTNAFVSSVKPESPPLIAISPLTPLAMTSFAPPPPQTQIVRRSFISPQHKQILLRQQYALFPPASVMFPYLVSPSTNAESKNHLDEDINQIHMAAGTGNLKLLNACFSVFDINYPDREGRTPLIYAVIGNDSKVIELLYHKGANLDSTDNDGRTAIHWAAYYGRFQILKMLIKFGATWTIHDSEGRTALHWSTGNEQTDCLEFLLERATSFEVNEPDNEQMTPLHWAIYHDHWRHLKKILKKKPNCRASDVEGKTALHWCAPHKEISCARMLLKYDPSIAAISDLDGRTPLHLACAENNATLVSLLASNEFCDINAHDMTMRTALHWATVSGHHHLVYLLLDMNASDSVKDGVGATPLHYACSKNHAQCIAALFSRENPGYLADNEGRHALIWAVTKGHVQSVRILLEKNVDVNLKDHHGSTALHAAAYAGQTHCVGLLLEHGALPDIADSHLHTPLFRAVEKGYAETANMLIQVKANVNRIDAEERSPLHWAALFGHLPVLSLLLANGANVDQPDRYGKTALHCGSYNGHNEVVKYLIECGADINKRDMEGLTSLHWSAIMGNPHTIELLIQEGAEKDASDCNFNLPTPLDYAYSEGQDSCVNVLLQLKCRTVFQIRTQAAGSIQRLWRGYATRKLMTSQVKLEMIQHLKQREAAACIIQRFIRKILRKLHRRNGNTLKKYRKSIIPSSSQQSSSAKRLGEGQVVNKEQDTMRKQYEMQLEIIKKHQKELDDLKKMTEDKLAELSKAMFELNTSPSSLGIYTTTLANPVPNISMELPYGVKSNDSETQFSEERSQTPPDVNYQIFGDERENLDSLFAITMSTAEQEYFRIEKQLRDSEGKNRK